MDRGFIIQSSLLVLVNFLLAQLDPNLIYFMSVVIGAASGSLISLKFKKSIDFKHIVIEFLSASLVGVILSITLSEYYQIINWKYLLGFSFLTGLAGLVIAKSLIVVLNESLFISVINKLLIKLNLKNDESTPESRRTKPK